MDNLKKRTVLCEIMCRNKSDKGLENKHNFTIIYYDIFKDIQFKSLRIFELGLGTNNVNIPSSMGKNGRPGASLYGWREFFVNSQIFGADIDKEILFETDKIKTFFCDQTDPNIINDMWNKDELKEDFDIIIEDGLHTFDANVCFFENSIHKLKPNGYYIIEDIIHNLKDMYEIKINEWKIIYPELSFKLLTIPLSSNDYDNTLLIVKKIT
jgi:SAM-dependent methyltransferase